MYEPPEDEIRTLAYYLWEKRGGGDQYAMADWLTAKRSLRLCKTYGLLAEHHFLTDNPKPLGDRANQRCRFCGRTPKDVKFKSIAHAIPHTLENRHVTSLYECNDCNTFFSNTLEDSFNKFTLPYRSAVQMRSRGGVPKYKVEGGRSEMAIENDQLVINAYTDENVFHLDEQKHELRVKVRTQPFVPIAAFKCMVKMALSILPESELPNFGETIAWIMEADHGARQPPTRPLALLFALTPGVPPDVPGRAMLFKRLHADAKVPYMMLVIESVNLTFQIPVASHRQDAHLDGQNIEMPRYPTGIWQGYRYGEPILRVRYFDETEKTRWQDTISYHIEQIIPRPPAASPPAPDSQSPGR